MYQDLNAVNMLSPHRHIYRAAVLHTATKNHFYHILESSNDTMYANDIKLLTSASNYLLDIPLAELQCIFGSD